MRFRLRSAGGPFHQPQRRLSEVRFRVAAQSTGIGNGMRSGQPAASGVDRPRAEAVRKGLPGPVAEPVAVYRGRMDVNPTRRVVVTGIGMVTPLAGNAESTWRRLIAGESGAGPITTFEVADLPAASLATCRAGQLPMGYSRPTTGWSQGTAQGRRLHPVCRQRRHPRRSQTRVGHPRPTRTSARTGVMIGSGIGGLGGIYEASLLIAEERPAAALALLHPRPTHQSRGRLRVDPARGSKGRTTPS